ncbi:electron carrier/ protein disulfide oxidoreductase [Anaeramoeba flamelloides]|uniref:Electron carrier/ protein disulfide oxidoreductase n=1 Tax=Anaeramoeba flamelloides TaxID=1746091 RepID=A0AAV8AEZ6_9EUKA|nr:electron carrier/ protein disulfide oxidoreductase [Anaeramoeba flamelloides]
MLNPLIDNSKKSKNYFPNNDPRIEFVTKFNPRIQFVISDLSSFSPPIQVFNPTTINKQLKQGAIDLCSEAEFHPISGRSSKKRYQLFLPKHLTPYIKDFGENEHRIIEFLLQYFPKETKSTVLFSLKKNQKIDIVFHSVSQLKNMFFNYSERRIPKDYKKVNEFQKKKKLALRGVRTRDIQIKSLTLCRLS